MQLNEITQKIKEIGLPEKAATIYAALLDLGAAYPSTIAEKTKLNRTTVYHILDDLAIKGLVTELTRGKKISYQIENPHKLIQYAKRQVKRSEERLEHAQKMLPELEGLFGGIVNKPRVRFFEGREGMLSVYEDRVAESKRYEMLSFNNVEILIPQLPKDFVKKYIKRKEELGVTTRAIFPDTKYGREYNKHTYKGINKKYLVQARFVPKEKFPYNGDLTVYGKNKVSVINFDKNMFAGVIIEDDTIANMMRMIFDLAWKGAEN